MREKRKLITRFGTQTITCKISCGSYGVSENAFSHGEPERLSLGIASTKNSAEILKVIPTSTDRCTLDNIDWFSSLMSQIEQLG